MQETQVCSLGLEDPLEKGMATPLQYSCLENSMDREAWQAIAHGIAESQTQPVTNIYFSINLQSTCTC